MTKEQIFTEIQNIVSANPVLVIGSGASVPYNIPGMNTLAAELKDFLGANPYKNPDSKKAVHEFIENLNHGMGLEKALLNTKSTDEVENDIVCKVWNLIEYADRDVYIKMLNGEDMALRPLLDFIIYKDPAKICNIVTTNYDRIIEYAACQTDAYINTGFTPNIVGHPYNKIEFSPKKIRIGIHRDTQHLESPRFFGLVQKRR